jgi:large subunit ribosomal protein L29
MKIQELRGKSPEELKSLFVDLSKELYKISVQKKLAEYKNTSRVKIVKRTIARIKTLIGEVASKGSIVKPSENTAVVKKAVVVKKVKKDNKV